MDERGFFARTFDADEFRRRRLNHSVAQCNISFNNLRGTLRGLHYQAAPHEEVKLVRCLNGGAFDVVVDLRADGPTYLQWRGFEITSANRLAVYVPERFAHGFMSLDDHVELLYQISAPYVVEAARGIRWDDPALHISWPLSPTTVSQRDRAWPLLPSANDA